MQLRQARMSDLPTLLAFEQGVLDAERPLDPWTKTAETHYYDLPALLGRERSRVLVVEQHGTPVASGYGDIRPAKEHHCHEEFCYLGMMYVLPVYRGQGLNQRIIDGLIAWASQRGIRHFALDVYHQNNAAISAYEKAGFSPALVEMRMTLKD